MFCRWLLGCRCLSHDMVCFTEARFAGPFVTEENFADEILLGMLIPFSNCCVQKRIPGIPLLISKLLINSYRTFLLGSSPHMLDLSSPSSSR